MPKRIERNNRRQRTRRDRTFYFGIDGEGQGREDHRYVLLATSDATGKRRDYIEAPIDGYLSTTQCFDFILRQPAYAKLFSFAFNYDLTKMMVDLTETDYGRKVLYRLFRPDLRKRPPKAPDYLGPKPESWRGYSLNLMGTKFTLRKGKIRRVIWDVFRFFQSKFTTALEKWKVGEPERLKRMREMKDKRSEFDKQSREDIRQYCFDECQDMAALAEKLTVAHEKAGLTLRNYFGAGSSASAMLNVMGIRNLKRTGLDVMDVPVASAFFGGRFEHSVIGSIQGPIWGYDISSAYPYQLTFLPCLACGTWTLTHKREDIENSRTALIRYSLKEPMEDRPWGPFPFRMKDGSIAFPVASGGGWVWKDEYLAGERLFPNVGFVQAWVYRCECDHKPFERIPGFYLERLKLGKEAAGIVIKLGCNSCYGKLAQSLGKPQFQSWIWAGMITSGTRAQILDMLGLHHDWSNMLMVATDGIYSREKLEPPTPRDTGTMTEEKKPLGGWERKVIEKGVFAARPGIYFPLSPTTEELESVRARGVGRGVMLSNWQKMVNAWDRREMKVKLTKLSRFHGAKSSVGKRLEKSGKITYVCHIDEDTGKPRYGQWTERPVELTFHPKPKREAINTDGTLQVRSFGQDEVSVPYRKSLVSTEALLLKLAAAELSEQPDGDDYSDYEEEEYV